MKNRENRGEIMRNLNFHVVEYSNRSVPPTCISVSSTLLDKSKKPIGVSYTILQNYGFGRGGTDIKNQGNTHIGQTHMHKYSTLTHFR